MKMSASSRRALAAASKETFMTAPNPIDQVRIWRVPKRKPDFLRIQKCRSCSAPSLPQWRPLFATAIYGAAEGRASRTHVGVAEQRHAPDLPP